MLRQIGFYLIFVLFLMAVVIFAMWLGEISYVPGLSDE
jgi:hypothetical protein